MRISGLGSALPEGDEYEDDRDDGQTEMTQSRARFSKQVIGLGFTGDEAGKGGKKQHAPKNSGAGG
jgi:hypothetical protein